MKKIKREVIDNVPVGLYLVTFEKIWGIRCNEGKHDDCHDHGCDNNEPSYIAEIYPIITKVTEKNYFTLEENVINCDDTWNAEKLWQDDTHDLRPRLFKRLKDAKIHVKEVTDRFNNPMPWEVFVKTA